MPGFSCSKCGHSWAEGHNMPGPCPSCGGYGPRDSRCICPHMRFGLAGQAQKRTDTDKACPVHGTLARAEPLREAASTNEQKS